MSDAADAGATHRPGSAPRLRQWDSSLALLRDPYCFIGRHCLALGSDVFETRLLMQRTLCISGPRAAELFYDDQRLQRAGAAPEPLRATLFGEGGVQGLDDAAHRHRKALFLAITAPERRARLLQCARQEWVRAISAWRLSGPMPLYRAIQPVLTRAACDWAGVPLAESDLALRSGQLAALFDGAAAGPLRHARARLARRDAEAWLAELVRAAHAGEVKLPAGAAAQALASHRDTAGKLLPPRVAAVELLNLLRPIVAVSLYISFVAHALHLHPAWKRSLGEGAATREALHFVQEVRRQYPFFPMVVARVRSAFDWQGAAFEPGRRVLLDLYGTNHDPRVWDEPHAFRPERWRDRAAERWREQSHDRWRFVPQGGGDAATQHRCPGEDVTLQLMLLSIEMLLRRMRYQVPPQNFDILMHRAPAVPADGFLIDAVRPLS